MARPHAPLNGSPPRVVQGTVIALLIGVAALLSGCASGGDAKSDDTTKRAGDPTTTVQKRKAITHKFVIPAGTAEQVKDGVDPKIIPRRLDVHVGDRIQIRNDDSEIARLGIFDVGPGETMSMTFNEVSVLTGSIFGDGGGCGSPPPENKKFIINVRP